MAITVTNPTYLGHPTASAPAPAPAQNPVLEGSQVLTFGGSDFQRRAYVGTATATLDGVATTFTHNYIDGTLTLSFTPTAVMAYRIGGTAAAGVFPTQVTIVDNKTATVTLAAAGANTNTVTYVFEIWK